MSSDVVDPAEGYSMVDNDSDDLVEVFPPARACVSSGEPSLDGSGDDDRALSDTEILHAARTKTIAGQMKGPSSDLLEGACQLEHEARARGDEWEDILGSGDLLKKTLKVGHGHEKIRDGQWILVKIVDTLRGIDSHESFRFITGFAMVIDAWELVAKLMVEGEICAIRTSSRFAYGSAGLDDLVGPNQQMEYTLEILEIQESPMYTSMPEEELSDFLLSLKERGNFFFSRQEFEKAIFVYNRAANVIEGPEDSEGLRKLFSALNSNLAVSYAKMDEWSKVEEYATNALSLHPLNTKAFYYRALALIRRNEIELALSDLQEAADIEPNEKSILREIERVKLIKKDAREKERQIYKKMVAGLYSGEAPHPATLLDSMKLFLSSRLHIAVLSFFVVMLGLFIHFLSQLRVRLFDWIQYSESEYIISSAMVAAGRRPEKQNKNRTRRRNHHGINVPLHEPDPNFPSLAINTQRARRYTQELRYMQLTQTMKPQGSMIRFYHLPHDCFHRLWTWLPIVQIAQKYTYRDDPYDWIVHMPVPPLAIEYKIHKRIPEDVYIDGVVRRLSIMRFHKVTQDSFEMRNDHYSMTPILYAELQRRMEISFRYGGGFRPTWRGARLSELLQSTRKCYLTEQKAGPYNYALLCALNAWEVRAAMKKRVNEAVTVIRQQLGSKEKKDIEKLQARLKLNENWVKARKALPLMPPLRAPLPLTLSSYRHSPLKPFVDFPQRTPHALFNEIVEYPPHTGYTIRMCETLKKLKLQPTPDGTIVVNKGQWTKSRPSRYGHQPIAAIVNRVGDNVYLRPDNFKESEHAPSIGRISGYSTVSSISTATTGPRHLKNQPLTNHPRHSTFDHRSELPSLTEHYCAKKAAAEYRQRLANETQSVLAELNRLPDDVRMDPRFMQWIQGLEMKPKLTDPVALAHALQVSLMTEERLGDLIKLPKLSRLQRMEARVLLSAYRRQMELLGQNRVDERTLELLPWLMNTTSSWTLDECNSRATLIPRCDRQLLRAPDAIINTETRARIATLLYIVAAFILLVALICVLR
ncbi:unnamed protein product, partial [Mesorhabditis spiculigera]